MPMYKLSKTGIKKVEKAVDALFERAKARLIGSGILPKTISVSVTHDLTLPGLFNAAAREEGVIPNQDTLESLMRIANNYLDAVKARTQARVVNEVQAFLRDASINGIDTDVQTVLGGKISDIWGEIKTQLHAIADSEASQTRNVSLMEGILKVNAAEGISDPVVYFVVVRDDKLCEECKRLHLLDNGKTPRVYKLSEVGHGYHKKGEDDPKLGGLHPHCRCTLVSLMPGYGFDKSGMVRFISRNYSEWDFQHGTTKSEEEMFEFLRKVDWKYADLLAEIKKFGFSHGGGGREKHIGHTSPLIPGATLDLKHEHMTGAIRQWWIETYGKNIGLRFARHPQPHFEPDPDSEFAEHYRKAGFLTDKKPIATWKPTDHSPETNSNHKLVPIDNISAVEAPSHDWRVAKVAAHLAKPETHALVKPIHVGKPEQIEGENLYPAHDGPGHEHNGIAMAAARKANMTHVPVIVG